MGLLGIEDNGEDDDDEEKVTDLTCIDGSSGPDEHLERPFSPRLALKRFDSISCLLS